MALQKKTKNDHSPVGYRVFQENTLIFCRRTCIFFLLDLISQKNKHIGNNYFHEQTPPPKKNQ